MGRKVLWSLYRQAFTIGYSNEYLKLEIQQGEKKTVECVEILFGLGTLPDWASLDSAYNTDHVDQTRMPESLIPIGSDPGGNKIVILLTEKSYGCVLFWDHDHEVDFSDPEEAKRPLANCSFIAKCFGEFVKKIEK